MQPLELADLVDRQIEVSQLLQPVDILDLLDVVILQVDNAKLAARRVEQRDAVNISLVQRDLLHGADDAVIVLGGLAKEVLGDPDTHSIGVSLRCKAFCNNF